MTTFAVYSRHATRVNMDHVPVEFSLPSPSAGTVWARLVDTAAWAEGAGSCWPAETADVMGARYIVHPWAIAVFQERA